MLATINKLQWELNTVAKVLYGGNKYDYITPLIWDKLHCLRIQRESFTNCLLTYMAVHKQQPQYLADFSQPVTSVMLRSELWSTSASLLLVPRIYTRLDHSFAISGARVRNSIPPKVHEADTITMFKRKHLFDIYYQWLCRLSVDDFCNVRRLYNSIGMLWHHI